MQLMLSWKEIYEKGEECRENIHFIYISGSTFLQGAQKAACTLVSIMYGASVLTSLVELFSCFRCGFFFSCPSAVAACIYNVLVYPFTKVT